jgi:phage portal protein BeeE
MTVLQAGTTLTEPKTLTRQVWSVDTARSIPGLGKGLELLAGLASQMPLDAYSGITPLRRPRLLEQPDLDKIRPLFVRLHVEDYLLHGNAAHLVTARGHDGWPAAVRWFPAAAWHVVRDEQTGRRLYWLNGRPVAPEDVVHVQRGADPWNDCRGVGVVEQYVNSLDRVALLDERQRQDTAGGHVPSVAVIAPQGDDSTDKELDEQAKKFEAKFDARNGGRRPAIFPHGTEVTPLAWSPHDSEASAAKAATLTDVANMLGLDGYWLGAPASSHTYRTPGPLFTVLMRTTLGSILTAFEEAWSLQWLVRGQRVTFGREAVTGDDLATMVATLTKASGGPIMTRDEARSRLALGPTVGGDEFAVTPAPPAAEPDPDPDDEDPIDPEETP